MELRSSGPILPSNLAFDIYAGVNSAAVFYVEITDMVSVQVPDSPAQELANGIVNKYRILHNNHVRVINTLGNVYPGSITLATAVLVSTLPNELELIALCFLKLL